MSQLVDQREEQENSESLLVLLYFVRCYQMLSKPERRGPGLTFVPTMPSIPGFGHGTQMGTMAITKAPDEARCSRARHAESYLTRLICPSSGKKFAPHQFRGLDGGLLHETDAKFGNLIIRYSIFF
jgi:hypothetical protein